MRGCWHLSRAPHVAAQVGAHQRHHVHETQHLAPPISNMCVSPMDRDESAPETRLKINPERDACCDDGHSRARRDSAARWVAGYGHVQALLRALVELDANE
jgi:hypothetical protein